MMIPTIDEARRVTSKKYEANVFEWKNILTDCIAHSISAATVVGKYRCTVDFTCYAQDEAFHDALNEIGNSMEQQGYDVLYTTSGDEAEDSLVCENIRVSWFEVNKYEYYW